MPKITQPQRASKVPSANRPFFCELCPKSYDRLGDLRRHAKSHSPYEDVRKPHLCEQCSTRFAEICQLNSHVKSQHLRQFGFVCDFEFVNPTTGETQRCGRRFNTNHELGHHKPKHNRPVARKVRRTRRTVARRQQRLQGTREDSFNASIPYTPLHRSELSDSLTAMSNSDGPDTPPSTYSYGAPTYVTHAPEAHHASDASVWSWNSSFSQRSSLDQILDSYLSAPAPLESHFYKSSTEVQFEPTPELSHFFDSYDANANDNSAWHIGSIEGQQPQPVPAQQDYFSFDFSTMTDVSFCDDLPAPVSAPSSSPQTTCNESFDYEVASPQFVWTGYWSPDVVQDVYYPLNADTCDFLSHGVYEQPPAYYPPQQAYLPSPFSSSQSHQSGVYMSEYSAFSSSYVS
ncbi:hypothetical protein CPC08DRAFT_778474 [Agrocybe pediades]|nr:hypothetical protein CPC08DRAFT_778474 [Agrocybe pediades]